MSKAAAVRGASAAHSERAPTGIAHPELERHGLGYVAHLSTDGVRVAVEGLRRGRDGLTADLTVEAGPVGGDGQWVTLTSGRLALASLSGREQWERRLSRRSSASADWGRILDGVCSAVLRAERRVDAPAIYLRDALDPPAGNMAIAPLVLANLPTLWFGADGTLKSYGALGGGLSVHTGLPLLGIAPSKSMRTAYLDFEPFDAGEHKRRMRRLLGVANDFPDEELPDLVYVECFGSTLVEQIERVQRVVRDEAIEFLVLDSIGFAADGPLNEDETARRFWQAVGQIGRPMLATGHTPKVGDELFGSRFWRAGARLAWHVSKFESETPGTAVLRFVCQKSSVEGMPHPVGLSFDFSDGQGVHITTTSTEDLVPTDVPLHERIAAVLRQRRGMAITYAELALQLGTTADNVKRAVNTHRKLFTPVDPAPGSRASRVGLRAQQEASE